MLSAKRKFADEETGNNLTLVLDDKTEVDDEEYFQTLADNTVFVMVHVASVERERGRTRQRNCDK